MLIGFKLKYRRETELLNELLCASYVRAGQVVSLWLNEISYLFPR